MLRFQHHASILVTIALLIIIGNFTFTRKLRSLILSPSNKWVSTNYVAGNGVDSTVEKNNVSVHTSKVNSSIDETDSTSRLSSVQQYDSIVHYHSSSNRSDEVIGWATTNNNTNTTSTQSTKGDGDSLQTARPFPHVAWLMSFPNSGTSYTMHTIQQYTRTTTATNYGQEQSPTEPTKSVHLDSPNGPFYRYPTWDKPSKYILTKTHCGGYCESCTPLNEFMKMTVESFEVECRSGKRIIADDDNSNINNIKVTTRSVPATYSADIPQRAVHLIRNPFDNIVARLHLLLRRWDRSTSDEVHRNRLDVFNATKGGFRSYCASQDQRDRKHWRFMGGMDNTTNDPLKYATMNLPCHTDFLRYIKWHNNAVAVTKLKDIPVLTLFYEDYGLAWESNIDRLFQFLSLSPADGAVPPEFIPGKVYTDYFTDDEIQMAKTLIQKLSTRDSWELLSRYFSTE